MLTFYIQLVAIFITLGSIYISLKWFRLPFVSKKLRTLDDEKLRRKSISQQYFIRFFFLACAILCDVSVYYLASYTTALWLCGMVVLCVPFVLPIKSRLEDDYRVIYGEE